LAPFKKVGEDDGRKPYKSQITSANFQEKSQKVAFVDAN
jgi:hypothetical protein